MKSIPGKRNNKCEDLGQGPVGCLREQPGKSSWSRGSNRDVKGTEGQRSEQSPGQGRKTSRLLSTMGCLWSRRVMLQRRTLEGHREADRVMMAQLRLNVCIQTHGRWCSSRAVPEVQTFEESYMFQQGEAGPGSSLPLYQLVLSPKKGKGAI